MLWLHASTGSYLRLEMDIAGYSETFELDIRVFFHCSIIEPCSGIRKTTVRSSPRLSKYFLSTAQLTDW